MRNIELSAKAAPPPARTFSSVGAPWLLRRRGWVGAFRFYALRFWSVRYLRTLVKRLTVSSKRSVSVSNRTLFPDHDVDRLLEKLRTESFYEGLFLPERQVTSIRRFAETTPATTWIDKTKVEFLLSNRRRVEQRYGKPIILASLPRASRDCEGVRELMRDPFLVEIARRYLGYQPTKVHARLFWSFACDAPVETRLTATQTIRFHYDAAHFLHFNFYMTAVDESAGPHVLVRNSHGPKSLSELLFSTTRSDEFIERKFGPDRLETLVGPAGFGFAEDQYCYHKAAVPRKKDRLMLMLHVF